MSILDRRIAFKPFEYPDVTKFKDAIQHARWLVSKWNFQSDVQDFHTKLDDKEKESIKRTLMAISQIELPVKRFWVNLGNRFPKPEIEQVGIIFGGSEVVHQDSYSHLLEVLGLNQDFESVLAVPAIQGRIDYLTKYLQGANKSDEEYCLTLALFSMFIENVSLFSQFVIMKSFNKYKNVLKDVDNVVQATALEEQIHALFGAWLVNQIKEEFPQWFTNSYYEKIKSAAIKAEAAESKIIDWIFEEGELDFCPKDNLKEFIKERFNISLKLIGAAPVFEVNKEKLSYFKWFDEEMSAELSTDFFWKKPNTYSKTLQSITDEDLF